jgi:hypothetical protein
MTDWFYQLPVSWMTVVIFAVTYGVSAGIWLTIRALVARHGAARFSRIAAGILSPLGTTFGFLVGFLAVQVWNDSNRAHEAVLHEAGALRTSVILASNLPTQEQARIDDLITRHIQNCVSREWPAMADQQANLSAMPTALADAIHVALEETPANEAQAIGERELVRSLEDAFEARRERIVISHESINWVKWATLAVQALLLLVTIGMVQCEHPDTGAIAMGIFATAAATSALLIASHARPFTGEISVSPQVLLDVMPTKAPQ